MPKEIENHKLHLQVTLERLIALLFSEQELNLIYGDKDHCAELLSSRVAWIKAEDLAIPGVTTPEMALCCLLWFQSIGRVIIEDVDPLSRALRLHLQITQEEAKVLS